jgi:hypothetical protein
MTRKHRLAHRLVWPALALVVAVGFFLALMLRPAAAAPASSPAERAAR